jgi:hypothetical protein
VSSAEDFISLFTKVDQIIALRICSHIFDVTQLKVAKKCKGFSIVHLLFADDAELMA